MQHVHQLGEPKDRGLARRFVVRCAFAALRCGLVGELFEPVDQREQPFGQNPRTLARLGDPGV